MARLIAFIRSWFIRYDDDQEQWDKFFNVRED